jgi:hypothetical protein
MMDKYGVNVPETAGEKRQRLQADIAKQNLFGI